MGTETKIHNIIICSTKVHLSSKELKNKVGIGKLIFYIKIN